MQEGDPLSDVLRMVKLTGALFFVTEATSPWRVEVPAAPLLAPAILPRARHVISYHIVTSGECWGALQGRAPVHLATGDVIVFPHGDAYAMSLTPDDRAELDVAQTLALFEAMAAGEAPFTIREGGGGAAHLHLVCGFLGCDLRPFNPLLAALPRLLHLAHPPASEPDLLEELIRVTISQARTSQAGAESIRVRLSELLFVELVRRHLATLPQHNGGWLAGLRDPFVGPALALLHRRPEHDWTLQALAGEVGLSRSALAERFARLVGQPPMRYLACWRIQIAARLLVDSSSKVSAVAFEVGYASEAAFSRAFKKIAGASPAAWRRQGQPRSETPLLRGSAAAGP